MGAYKDKNGTWYAQFRYTNWKGEPDRKTKRGFATKKEALEWEREFLTQSSGNLEMTFEAFYELYKKNMKERIKLSTWNMKESVIESKILPYFKKKRMCDIKPRDIVEWQNVMMKIQMDSGETYSPVYLKTIHNQLNMAMTQIMNSNPFDTALCTATQHLVVEIGFGQRENAVIFCDTIKTVNIVFQFFCQKIRHLNIANTIRGLRLGNIVFTLDSLIRFVDTNNVSFEIYILWGKGQHFTKSKATPI